MEDDGGGHDDAVGEDRVGACVAVRVVGGNLSRHILVGDGVVPVMKPRGWGKTMVRTWRWRKTVVPRQRRDSPIYKNYETLFNYHTRKNLHN